MKTVGSEIAGFGMQFLSSVVACLFPHVGPLKGSADFIFFCFLFSLFFFLLLFDFSLLFIFCFFLNKNR